MAAFEESKSISENRPLVKNMGILALQFVSRINLCSADVGNVSVSRNNSFPQKFFFVVWDTLGRKTAPRRIVPFWRGKYPL